MRRLVLHIGTPKTGTTAIQAAIAEQTDRLSQNGILYPRTGRHRAAHNHMAQSLTREGPALAAALADEVAAQPADTVLLSSEIFALVPPDRLRAILPDLEGVAVEVIVYLRRQDRYAEAFYKQKAKNGRMRIPFGDFLASPHCAEITNYPALIAAWQEAFPGATMRPRIFERHRFVDGDVIADFAGLLGLAPGTLTPVAVEHNLSPSRPVIDLLLAIAPHLSKAEVAQVYRRMKAQDLPGFAVSNDLFDPGGREAFLAAYAAQNEALRKTYFPEQASLFAAPGEERPSRGFDAGQAALITALAEALLSLDRP